MKKLSLILLSSACFAFGFAQSTETKTAIKETQEFSAQPVKANAAVNESKLESSNKKIEFKEAKIQNKSLLLRKEELNTTVVEKKEATEIKENKNIEPSKN